MTVSLLGRDHHKKHFQENKVLYESIEGLVEVDVPIKTLEDLERDDCKPDIVMITLKANNTMNVVEDLAKHLSPEIVVVSLQNGLVAQDIADFNHFSNVVGCVVGFNIKVNSLGHVTQTSPGKLVLGQVGQVEGVSQTIIDLLSYVAPVEVSQNFVGDQWMKVLINSTINPICALGDFPLGDLPKKDESIFLALWIWKELVDAARALGVKLEPFEGKLHPEMLYMYDIPSYGIAKTVVRTVVKPHKDALVSMVQDIRAGRVTEVDYLNGKVVSLANDIGMVMPVNQLLIQTIKEIEAGTRKPSQGVINKLYREVIKSRNREAVQLVQR